MIFKNSDPEVWYLFLKQAVTTLSVNKDNPQFVVIKSWNEWAEGNYLEPDVKFGRKWLEKIKQVKNETNTE